MKLQLQCDECGKVGTPQEIFTNRDGRDVCNSCNLTLTLGELKAEHARKKEWLESTHLQDLQGLEEEMKEIEQQIQAERPPSLV